MTKDKHPTLSEVLPKAGLVYSQRGNLSHILCKPKLMPIKSAVLEKIEEMEKQARGQCNQEEKF